MPLPATPLPRDTLRLSLLFGTIYFVQGMSEPTTGLISQPNQSLLREWGESPEQIGLFVAILAAPWCLKPLFGFLSDFVPLGRYRRRGYLIVSSLVALIGFIALAWVPMAAGDHNRLLSWLLVPTVAVIFADVVIDATMIEAGQPRGITGRLQSVQWAAIYAGSILTGVLGGYLSEFQEQRLGYLICGGLMTATLVLSIFAIHERPARPSEDWRRALVSLGSAARSRPVIAVGTLLFLWHFNPCCQAVIYLHMTDALGFSEKFYGETMSLIAVGSLMACVAYGFYCRRIAMRRLIRLAVVLGLASTWAYWHVTDRGSAAVISVVVGFTYMTASMILVDLAARACPIEAAGTMFALFMALCNISSAATTWLGGWLYQAADDRFGSDVAFQMVVAIGGLLSTTSYLVVRYLPDHLLDTHEVVTVLQPVALVLPELPVAIEAHQPHVSVAAR
jgi:MFS family permease